MNHTVTIISSMATKSLLADLVAAYQQRWKEGIDVVSIGGVDATKRVQAGESFDAVVLAAGAIDKLASEGHVVVGSRRDLVTSGVAVAIRAGAHRPAIHDEEALRLAVLNAASVSYSTGPSGVHLAQLFERWGIAGAIQDRIVQAPPGVSVGSLIAEGRAELGFQQLSELMNLKGIEVIGPLPGASQIITTFSAGITTVCHHREVAGRMLDFMTSPDAIAIKQRNGMEVAA